MPHRGADHRDHRRAVALAAALAGHADRGRRRPRRGRRSACPSRRSARASAAFRVAALAGAAGVRPRRCRRFCPTRSPSPCSARSKSLLSAVVADGMTGRRHRSNCELVAQGFANIGSALFGGICVTGTIARTATNVRAGARRAGLRHAALRLSCCCSCWSRRRWPATSRWPRWPACWRSSPGTWWRRHAFAALLRSSRGDALVLLVTFLLVVFRDLTEGIVVGFALGSILFIHRMSSGRRRNPAVSRRPPQRKPTAQAYDATEAPDPDTVVYRISGAFFFGAASTVGACSTASATSAGISSSTVPPCRSSIRPPRM